MSTHHAPPQKLDVHGATPARRGNITRELPFPHGELLISEQRDGYRLTFRKGTEERVVEGCSWDSTAKTLTGSAILGGTNCLVRAQLVEDLITGTTFMMGLIVPNDIQPPTDDPDATGGWTAQEQGGKAGGPPG